jgi:hypothetical protein
VEAIAKIVGRHAQVDYETIYRNHSGKKRAAYERAHQKLIEFGGFCPKRYSRITMFVKLEGIKFNPQKVNPDCRAIQFRTTEYTLQLASCIRGAEHRMYVLEDFPGCGPGRLFAKGLNQVEKASQMRVKYEWCGRCHILCLDASRFDAHCQKLILWLVEHRFWMETCLGVQLEELLGWQLDNNGTWRSGDQSVKYKVSGGRMSGDANTGAGNCIIMAVMLIAFGNASGRKFTFLCDGDDSVFFHDGEPISDEEIKTFFEQFGFVMEVEARPTCLEETTFCQARPVYVDGREVMIRDPTKILSKATVSHKLNIPAIRGKYIKTVALGELSISRGCPVVQAYLVALIRNCEKSISKAQVKKGPVFDWVMRDNEYYRLRSLLPSDWKSGRTVVVTTEARMSFARAWGIPVERQLVIERTLETWNFDLGQARPGGDWDVGRWLPPMFRAEEW